MGAEIVFVVGAGASKEFKLPLGADLTASIADLLDIRYSEIGHHISGDGKVLAALQSAAANNAAYKDYFQAAAQIHEGMPLAPSIDDFLSSHPDPCIELCGKVAIARAILNAERRSHVYTDWRRPDVRPSMSKLGATWFRGFWHVFARNCSIDAIPKRAKSIAFVIFNYDRCIEHCLFHALRAYYGIPEQHAASIVNNIAIYHPYGMVGSLPWQSKPTPITFGAEPSTTDLLAISSQIKTFSEGADPASSKISELREALNNSRRVVFLGFAFHEQNIKLLWPEPIPDTRTTESLGNRREGLTLGTASGISDNDVYLIKKELVTSMNLVYDPQLRTDLHCARLFEEYRRSLQLEA